MASRGVAPTARPPDAALSGAGAEHRAVALAAEQADAVVRRCRLARMRHGAAVGLRPIQEPRERSRRTAVSSVASHIAASIVSGPNGCALSPSSIRPCPMACQDLVSPQDGHGRPVTRRKRQSTGPSWATLSGSSIAPMRAAVVAARSTIGSVQDQERRSGRPFASGRRSITMRMRSTSAQIPRPPQVTSFRMPSPVYPR